MADVNPIDLQKALGGMNYPASKEDLIKHVKGKLLGQSALGASSRSH